MDVYKFSKELYRQRHKYSIVIRRNSYTLSLLRDGTLIKQYPIAIGKPSTPTPTGTFKIINKAVNPGGPFGARWLGLNKKGYGIHGTNNASSIGKAVSNGCIRMHNNNVIELFKIVPIGTQVTIL
jgi:lipoprotein-anchoring transpeptidase ErfK/SrfK